MIPPCDAATGNLPPGVDQATWGELVARFGSTSHRLALLSFFQRDRDSGQPKGIIAIDLGGLP